MPSSQALLKSTSAGRSRQVRLLLDSGSSVEEVDNHGQTPLIKAVFVENDSSRQKILRLLLKYGATVSKADVVGRNALAWSCIYGRDEDVAILLENADVDLDVNKTDINGQTALYHAVSSGNASCVKIMVEAPAEIWIKCRHSRLQWVLSLDECFTVGIRCVCQYFDPKWKS